MTYPPGQPGGQPQPMPPGYPPQSGYPAQPGYPQPYPQAPPTAGTTVAASILLTITCLTRPTFHPPLVVIDDILAGLAGILVIVSTIMLWARQPLGRLLAITGLSAAAGPAPVVRSSR